MIAGASRPPERSCVEADERPGRLGTAGETSRRTEQSVERRREQTEAAEPSFSFFFFSLADEGSWTHTFFSTGG